MLDKWLTEVAESGMEKTASDQFDEALAELNVVELEAIHELQSMKIKEAALPPSVIGGGSGALGGGLMGALGGTMGGGLLGAGVGAVMDKEDRGRGAWAGAKRGAGIGALGGGLGGALQGGAIGKAMGSLKGHVDDLFMKAKGRAPKDVEELDRFLRQSGGKGLKDSLQDYMGPGSQAAMGVGQAIGTLAPVGGAVGAGFRVSKDKKKREQESPSVEAYDAARGQTKVSALQSALKGAAGGGILGGGAGALADDKDRLRGMWQGAKAGTIAGGVGGGVGGATTRAARSGTKRRAKKELEKRWDKLPKIVKDLTRKRKDKDINKIIDELGDGLDTKGRAQFVRGEAMKGAAPVAGAGAGGVYAHQQSKKKKENEKVQEFRDRLAKRAALKTKIVEKSKGLGDDLMGYLGGLKQEAREKIVEPALAKGKEFKGKAEKEIKKGVDAAKEKGKKRVGELKEEAKQRVGEEAAGVSKGVGKGVKGAVDKITDAAERKAVKFSGGTPKTLVSQAPPQQVVAPPQNVLNTPQYFQPSRPANVRTMGPKDPSPAASGGGGVATVAPQKNIPDVGQQIPGTAPVQRTPVQQAPINQAPPPPPGAPAEGLTTGQKVGIGAGVGAGALGIGALGYGMGGGGQAPPAMPVRPPMMQGAMPMRPMGMPTMNPYMMQKASSVRMLKQAMLKRK